MSPRKSPLTGACWFAVLLLLLACLPLALAQQTFQFDVKDGAYPQGEVLFDDAGNLYGSTSLGGADDAGLVYELSSTSNGSVTEAVLYDFTGNSGDGANPIGNLLFDDAGNLYGVTEKGGASNAGTVFELSPPASPGAPWTERILYSFRGGSSDGALPVAGLTWDPAGNLYGTTSGGGLAFCSGGCGTVFELMPPSQSGGQWTESVLYFFGASLDGGEPMGGLIIDGGGNLYGTTYLGGLGGQGVVFELRPPAEPGGSWTQSTLHSFHNAQGIRPLAGLTFAPDGSLVGTTSEGGASDFGTVFHLIFSPGNGRWSFAVVYSFDFVGSPAAKLTFGGRNILYGTTLAGSVFQLSYSGGSVNETVLFGFFDGHSRAGVTLYKGALYGTMSEGGFNNVGAVFRVRPAPADATGFTR